MGSDEVLSYPIMASGVFRDYKSLAKTYLRGVRMISPNWRWPVSEADFGIIYDGEAVAENTMPVRELAPALLAVGGLIEESNRVLNEGRARTSVHVRAGPEPGSFGIELLIEFGLVDQLHFFAGQEDIWQAPEILRAIGIVGGAAGGLVGLIQLLRELGGREPDKVQQTTDGTIYEIHGDNNVVLHGAPGVERLRTDPAVRKELGESIRPLKKKGYDEVRFERMNEVQERVTREQAEYLSPPKGEDVVSENVEILQVEIIQPVFDESNKFRLFDGDRTFYASVKDEEFWEKIHEREKGYYEGDIMNVRMRSRQVATADGKLKKDYEVLDVLEHKHVRQGHLLDDEDHQSSE